MVTPFVFYTAKKDRRFAYPFLLVTRTGAFATAQRKRKAFSEAYYPTAESLYFQGIQDCTPTMPQANFSFILCIFSALLQSNSSLHAARDLNPQIKSYISINVLQFRTLLYSIIKTKCYIFHYRAFICLINIIRE